MTLERGTLLHKRYRIVEILGQGGMGSIYRAVDEHLGVDVAVKENLFSTEEYARQFRLEAVILANLRHPNLPRVSDHFVITDEGQYLVMDYVDGEDLRQYMERVGLLSEEDVIHIGSAMCDALAYLHTRKPLILHRDIKPGNVKITPDGRIILVDFGLAKVSQGNQATTIGARAMTPGYSPPEQYGAARTDPRTDIYSLGATLYAALSGVIPEDGLARAMDTAELTPLRKRNPAVSRRLASAVEKALSVDPSDRFQTAEEFKRALVESKSKPRFPAAPHTISSPTKIPSDGETLKPQQQPVQLTQFAAEEDKPFVSPRKKLLQRESRVRRTIIGVLLTILAVGFLSVNHFFPGRISEGVQALFAAPSRTETFITAVPVTPAFTPESTALPIPTVTESIAPTPLGADQLQIAFASTRLGVAQIYIIDLLEKNPKQLTDIAEGACQPSWSPDGQKLVFISPCKIKTDSYPDSSLYLINADGTGLQNLQSVPGGDFEPDWSPDGKSIAFTSQRTGYMQIYVYDLKTNLTTRVTHTKSSISARQPAWSPDGRQIAYALRQDTDNYQIWLMSDTGKNQRQLVQSGDQFSDYSPEWSPDGRLILFHQRSAVGFSFPGLMMISLEADAEPVKLYMGILSIDHVSYSQDGFWLAYESPGERGSNIYTMTVTGANQMQLTSDVQDDFDPVWRPIVK